MRIYIKPAIYIIKTEFHSCLLDASGGGDGGSGNAADAHSKSGSFIFDDEDTDNTPNTTVRKSIWDE